MQFSGPVGSVNEFVGSFKEQRRAFVSIYLLITLYVVLAYKLAGIGAFWSPDCGVRFAMVHSLLRDGSLVRFQYPFSLVDPTGKINPLGYFLFHRRNDFVPQYEPAFPLMSALPYKYLGFFGLAVIPLVSGIGTVLILYKTAMRLRFKFASYFPVAAGLGTPIVTYSIVFWDHSLIMVIIAAAGYTMLRGLQDDGYQYFAYAGATLSAGIFVHELVLAVFVAVLLGAVPLLQQQRGRRILLSLLAGFLPVALLWLLSNQVIYDNIAGAHLSANMGANQSDHPFSPQLLLDFHGFADRSQAELIGIMSTGIMLSEWEQKMLLTFNLFAVLLAAYFFTCVFLGAGFGIVQALCLLAAGLSVYFAAELHWLDGLFEATPLFIPALAVSWIAEGNKRISGSEDKSLTGESLYMAWISRSAWVFVLICIVNPMLPGDDWGGRYLLPILPFLVLMSAYALELQYSNTAPRWRTLMALSTVLLIGMSIYCQAEGLTMIRRSILYNAALNRRIIAVPTAVVVYFNVGTGAEAAAVLHMNKVQFLVRDSDDWREFCKAMFVLRKSDFTFIGSLDECDAFRSVTVSRDTGFPTIEPIGRSYFSPSLDEDGGTQEFVHYMIQTNKSPEGSRN
jgi:hypothetical protein